MEESVLLKKYLSPEASHEDVDKFFKDFDRLLSSPDIETRYEEWVRGDDRFYTKTGVSDRICPGTGLYVEPSELPTMTSYINCGDNSICIHFNKKDSKE